MFKIIKDLEVKKYLKYISLVLFCCLPIGVIIYFSTPIKSLKTLTIAGSSSVQPLMVKLGNFSNLNLDLVVQGGGSGFGMSSIANSTKDVGLSSKNTYESVQKATILQKGYSKQTWEIKKIKTLTIGWDSIAIVYKGKYELNFNNQNDFAKLYDLMSGNKKYKINELSKNSNDDSYFVPYGRTGGADSSGTAASFLNESTFDWNQPLQNFSKQDLNKIKNVLNKGSYLNNNVRVTNESNVETFNKILNENFENAITYLSMSFVLQNKEILKQNNIKVAKVFNVDPFDYLEKNQKIDLNFLNLYKWFSPYNILISLENTTDDLKNFVKWLYVSKESTSAFNELKLVKSYNKDKLEIMKAMISDQLKDKFDNDFDVIFDPKNSDINLEKNNKPFYSNANQSIKKNNLTYGVAKQVVLDLNKN